MLKKTDKLPIISDSSISSINKRLAAGKQVRRTLPLQGRLHIDRTLPFLVVYRRSRKNHYKGTEHLVKGEASYLIASASSRLKPSLTKLVHTVVSTLSKECGAFLIIEIWPAPEAPVDMNGRHHTMHPLFRIIGSRTQQPATTIETLKNALTGIKILRKSSVVEEVYNKSRSPAGLKPLLLSAEARKLNCDVIGLEMQPIYFNPATDAVFPFVLRALHRGLSLAFKRAAFEFSHTETTQRPRNYQALGRRAVVNAVWDVDSKLAEISNSYDFLLQLTPVNTGSAWKVFKRSLFERAPALNYRPLPVDPAILKHKLYEIHIDRIEDPTLAFLFSEKRKELDRQLSIMGDRNSPEFLYGSLQLYGGVSDELSLLADKLLKKLPGRSRDDSKGGYMKASVVAEHAKSEIEFYRQQYPSLSAKVLIREDTVGLMVSRGNLLVGKQAQIPVTRLQALLQHEIGTHVLTYFNGKAQPFKQLYSGLAGYEALQEGLAVLAEYLVDGLSRPRLRLLAGRVAAVRCLIQGATFIDTFRELTKTYGFKQKTAFSITVRIYRSGGFTKDAVYLRGLVELLDYLKKGGAIAPLFVGKIATEHISIIKELQYRKVLQAPPLTPRYMQQSNINDKLEKLRRGLSPLDLVTGVTK